MLSTGIETGLHLGYIQVEPMALSFSQESPDSTEPGGQSLSRPSVFSANNGVGSAVVMARQ
jgi:hypothetical protein